ncbi:MAG: tail fiber domain-containing protein [Minisyncoccia bacterium]
MNIHTKPFRSAGFITIIFLLSIFSPFTSFGAEGINAQIPFQGTLKNSSGTALTGAYDMVFKIYDAATAGTLLWTGTYNAVSVSTGSFEVMLGSGASPLNLNFNDDSYYLGVTVGTDPEMIPRERLGASGYAINADLLDGLHASSFFQADQLFSLSLSSTGTLFSLDQQDSGDLMNLRSGGADVLTVLNNGSLNVQSPDTSFFAGNVQFADGSGVYLGSEDDGIGGLSLYMDTTDAMLGANVLMIGMRGDAVLNNSADITTPGSLSLNANSMNGPTLSLGTDGNVTISVGSDPSNLFTVNGMINSTALLGGATALSTDANGNIIRDPSDERLKKNIRTIDDALDIVLSLHGVRYEWKDIDRFGNQTEVGFIAQELQPILPEVVRDGGEYLSVNIKNIVAVVVEAIKEINTKIESYFARTERLEQEVARLRAEIDALNGNSHSEAEPAVEEPIVQDSVEESPAVPHESVTEEVVSSSVEQEVPVEEVIVPTPSYVAE